MAPMAVVFGQRFGGRKVEIEGDVALNGHAVTVSLKNDILPVKDIVKEAKNQDPLAQVVFMWKEGEKSTSVQKNGQAVDFAIEIARDITGVTLQ